MAVGWFDAARSSWGGMSLLSLCPFPSLGRSFELHLSSAWMKTRATSPRAAVSGVWWLWGECGWGGGCVSRMGLCQPIGLAGRQSS